MVVPAREDLPHELSKLVGTIVADAYRLDEVIGAGNMGVVFKGVQIKLKRPIAVKVLDPEVATSERSARRFQREAESVARLAHINCLQVYDYGTTDRALHYMVMPLLNGRPLDELLARENFSPRRALEVIEQVLAGLSHAHEQGLVHRDLKPSNILIENSTDNPGGIVKIVDFGIAKIVDEDASFQTRTGMLFGTPAYMSPEQALGEPIDLRSDLYSAGLVLYRMLAGDVPHRAKSLVDQMRRRVTLDVPALPAPCPPQINDIIAGLSAREADGRFATADIARRKVRALLDAAPRNDAEWDRPLPGVEPPAEKLGTLMDASHADDTRAAPRELLGADAATNDDASTANTSPVVAADLAAPHVPDERPDLAVAEASPKRRGVPSVPGVAPDDEAPSFRPAPDADLDASIDERDGLDSVAKADDFHAPRRGPIVAGLLIAGATMIGIGVWWFTQPPASPEVAAAGLVPEGEPQFDRASAAPSPANPPPNTPDVETTPAPEIPAEDEDGGTSGDGSRSVLERLRRVNERDPEKALPFAERHTLLDELRADADAAPLVDLTTAALLDLEQAADAPQPCVTFEAALVQLAESSDTRARLAVRTANLPAKKGPGCVSARRKLSRLQRKSSRSGATEPTEASAETTAGTATPNDAARAGAITEKIGGLK